MSKRILGWLMLILGVGDFFLLVAGYVALPKGFWLNSDVQILGGILVGLQLMLVVGGVMMLSRKPESPE
jgi:hypothetical protein